MHDGTDNGALPGADMAGMRSALFGIDADASEAESPADAPEALEVRVTAGVTSTGATRLKTELLSNGVVVAAQG